MGLFEVYNLLDMEPVQAKGTYLWDAEGRRYLDFYGGHAVISIGHCHPTYVKRIGEQLGRIGFYSNAVKNSLQSELADKIGRLSGYDDYNLFLCNSGAEANENAIKAASFLTGRDAVLAISGAFHGRTSEAVAVTDNPGIQAPVNSTQKVAFVPLNDVEALQKELSKGIYAAIIIEGIQGVGGIRVPDEGYLQAVRKLSSSNGTFMIVDEVQSGCGRTGKFFAHSYASVRPDMITMAKGIGNGFPMAGVLFAPSIEARKGMLGTTFGGSHLACAASLAVMEVIENEGLMSNASILGNYLMGELGSFDGVVDVRGRGLMIGVDLRVPQIEFRRRLLADYRVMTGYSGTNTIRILPPLNISYPEAKAFILAFRQTIESF